MTLKHHPILAKKLAIFTSLLTIALIVFFFFFYKQLLPSELNDNLKSQWGALLVMPLMLTCGGIGGCLYNLRGITKHMQNQDFYEQYELTYYLRPLSGSLCGLFVFALMYGGVLTLTLGASEVDVNDQSVFLYIAVSLLAGYGSHEFLRKVKDINRTLFALSETESRENKEEMST